MKKSNYLLYSVVLLSNPGISFLDMKSPIYYRQPSPAYSIIDKLGHTVSSEKLNQDRDQSTSRWMAQLPALNSVVVEQRLDALYQLGSENYTAEEKSKVTTAVSNVLLKDKSPVVRAMAASTLEHLRDTGALVSLKESLNKERQPAVIKAVVYAIASYKNINDQQIISKLVDLLKNRKRELRAAAAFALAETGDNQVSPALIKLLRKTGKDEDSFAKAQAARALGRIAPKGDPDTIEALVHSLNDDDSQDVKREAARALGFMAILKDQKAIDALKKAQLSSDPYLAQIADESLNKINDQGRL